MATEIQIADKPTLDTINTNVGSNADGSSTTGSIHAKLKTILTSIASLVTSVGPKTYYHGCFNTASTTYVTALSVTGAGEVYAVLTALDTHIKITVDGVKFFEFTGQNYGTLSDTSIGLAIANYDYVREPAKFSFKNSLLIEIKTISTKTANVGWGYFKN